MNSDLVMWVREEGYTFPAAELEGDLIARGADPSDVPALLEEAERLRGDATTRNGRPQPATDPDDDLYSDEPRDEPAPARPRSTRESRGEQQPAPLIPQNLDAEESVLGAMMIAPAAIDAVAPILEAADFYRESHGLIYSAALALHERGDPVTALSVADELERTGRIRDVPGGEQRIRELAILVPATANARHYAGIVRRKADARHVLKLGALVEAAYDGTFATPDALAALDHVRGRLAARADTAALAFAPLDEFVEQDEAAAEPLLGSPGDMALPVDGTLLLYGDGGASKTTLTIDAVAHLAAGIPWLGLAVARPLNVAVIENEGPREPFREKLRRKRDTWDGPPFAPRVHVFEAPWGRFTFADDSQRQALATYAREQEIDLVVSGPLAGVGAEGGGTPDEVRTFEALLTDLRRRAERPLALWIVHHENKAGDVSGAWSRMPDTLAHARLADRERTVLHWRKARWSSTLHGDSWTLAWATECEGFTRVDSDESEAAKAARRAEALAGATAWIVAYVDEHPGESRTAVEQAYAEGHGRGARGLARDAIDAQLLANANGEHSQLAKGPGRAANGVYLYPASHLSLPLADGVNGEHGEQSGNPASEAELASSPPPLRGGEQNGEHAAGVGEPDLGTASLDEIREAYP